jgi:hypothetical protein
MTVSSHMDDVGLLLRQSGGLTDAIMQAVDAASIIAIIRTHLTPSRDSFESPLRRFAWHCARDVAHFTRGPAHEALLEAGRLAAGLGTSSYLLAAREAARPDADTARAVGMARCEPSAAAFLAAFHSCAANVFDAARQSADCAAKVSFFREARIRADVQPRTISEQPWEASRRVAEWLQRHRSELESVEAEVRRRQADVLRALLGVGPGRVLPFAPSLFPHIHAPTASRSPRSAAAGSNTVHAFRHTRDS